MPLQQRPGHGEPHRPHVTGEPQVAERIERDVVEPVPGEPVDTSLELTRFRQRYLDLMANPEVRQTFRTRSAVVSAAHCHCRDCQRATGSAFATFCIVPEAAFSVEGEPSSWHVEGESGRGVDRSFCGTCGSQLYSQVEVMPGLFFVKTGVMDDTGR